MNHETVVKINQVSKSFPSEETPAVNQVSTTIQSGKITGLVGPDAAGKTTLIRMIAGLMVPDEGDIQVFGLDSVKQTKQIHNDIGYMPQKFGLYEDLSVIENLNLYSDLRDLPANQRKETMDRLLSFTDLKRFTDRLAGRLSGGMKQKLGLACALIKKPKLLLLDEPGVGVDPISRRELWSMVKDLVDEGIAILWSTAYLDEAEMCDSILLMNEGQVLYEGVPTELTSRVEGRCYHLQNVGNRKRQLLKQALSMDGIIDGVIQGSHVRIVTESEETKIDTNGFNTADSITLKQIQPRFEDAFIDILGGGPGGESSLADRMPVIEIGEEAMIETKDLTKKFGDFAATDRVSFAVNPGEIFGLLGPNGAGKSTTFKMLCGLLTPTSGSALVTGLDIKKASSQARARLGYMAQKFSLYGNLTVRQNLNFFASIYGLKGKKRTQAIDQMIETFDLTPYLGSASEQLPLGYKQRLALSCAVMHSPRILFLDEPTSGVDPITRREFWAHINGLVEKGVTVMVTTHFMDEAEYCDRVALMFRGEMIALGTPDDLKNMAVHDDHPEPTMEEAFIELVTQSQENTEQAA